MLPTLMILGAIVGAAIGVVVVGIVGSGKRIELMRRVSELEHELARADRTREIAVDNQVGLTRRYMKEKDVAENLLETIGVLIREHMEDTRHGGPDDTN